MDITRENRPRKTRRAETHRQRDALEGGHSALAGREASRLGNTLKQKSSTETSPVKPQVTKGFEKEDFSRLLWRLQAKMWGVTHDKNLRGCHRWLAPHAGGASVQWGEKRSRFGQLQNSRSVWASPVASLKIGTLRAAEVQHALDNWMKTPGNGVAFATLTLRHRHGQTLREVWDTLAYCWARVTQTAKWRGGSRTIGDKEKYAIAHWIKTVEVTHGKNGWHVHIHTIFLTEKQLSENECEELRSSIFSRWQAGALKRGFAAPSEQNGVKIDAATTDTYRQALANYLVKGHFGSLGHESAGGSFKLARGENMTPFQILDCVDSHDPDMRERAIKLWHEWEKVSKGRRQMAWSKGAKKELGIVDLTDDELLDMDEREQEEMLHTLGIIALAEWKKIQSDIDIRLHILHEVKKAKNKKGAHKKLAQVMSELGIPYTSIGKPGFPLSSSDSDLSGAS